MRRVLDLFFLSLCVALVALGAPAAAAPEGSAVVSLTGPEAAPVADASPEVTVVEGAQGPGAEATLPPLKSCSPGLEGLPGSTLAFSAPALFEECVGRCKTNSDCDVFCNGDGGCDLNPANPCYRQCLCF